MFLLFWVVFTYVCIDAYALKTFLRSDIDWFMGMFIILGDFFILIIAVVGTVLRQIVLVVSINTNWLICVVVDLIRNTVVTFLIAILMDNLRWCCALSFDNTFFVGCGFRSYIQYLVWCSISFCVIIISDFDEFLISRKIRLVFFFRLQWVCITYRSLELLMKMDMARHLAAVLFDWIVVVRISDQNGLRKIAFCRLSFRFVVYHYPNVLSKFHVDGQLAYGNLFI